MVASTDNAYDIGQEGNRYRTLLCHNVDAVSNITASSGAITTVNSDTVNGTTVNCSLLDAYRINMAYTFGWFEGNTIQTLTQGVNIGNSGPSGQTGRAGLVGLIVRSPVQLRI